ncbi:MAG: ferredoxin--NADP reductase [Candidatus Eiseniibacteriota bacterium]
MPELTVKLGKREEVAEGTWSFRLRTDEPFDFRPGQTVDLTWPTAPTPDPRGHKRTFSIANTPGSDLMIATRIRESPFKKDLLAAQPGTEIHLEGPFGDFNLPKNPADVVMLAGGIGVTPFRSMLEDATARSLTHDLSLIHVNRTPEETPFLEELRRWTTANHRFTYVPTMTRPERSKTQWLGLRGRADAAFLEDVLDDGRASAFYMVAGPLAFVEATRKALEQVGVPDGRVRSEDFPGY